MKALYARARPLGSRLLRAPVRGIRVSGNMEPRGPAAVGSSWAVHARANEQLTLLHQKVVRQPSNRALTVAPAHPLDARGLGRPHLPFREVR